MNKLPERFKRHAVAFESRKRMDELKKRPLTGKDKAERKQCIEKLNKLADEYGRDRIDLTKSLN